MVGNLLYINGTPDSPEIRFIPEESRLLIKGRSLPEDAYTLYRPLIDWARSQSDIYTERNLYMDIELDYFNSSSGRYLLEFLAAMEQCLRPKTKALIRWYVEKEDELMMEKGEEFRQLIEIPFEIVYLD